MGNNTSKKINYLRHQSKAILAMSVMCVFTVKKEDADGERRGNKRRHSRSKSREKGDKRHHR